MEKELTIYIRVKVPDDPNIYALIEKLRAFLNEVEILGEITCDFTTFTPDNSFSMRR